MQLHAHRGAASRCMHTPNSAVHCSRASHRQARTRAWLAQVAPGCAARIRPQHVRARDAGRLLLATA